MNNLATNFCDIHFDNPTVLASGILGVSGLGMADVIAHGAGGVTTKSIWLKNHPGHKNPVMIANEHMIINAVGLSGAGIEATREEITEYKKNCSAPLIGNIVAGKIDDFAEITRKISETEVDLIEVNISCPNVEDEFGTPFACDIKSAAEVCRVVRQNTKKKFSIKLSPNVNNIGEIAKACENAGADAITAINTVGPGMRINIDLRTPILKNKVGGVSGPAILPIALKNVNDISKAVKIPIIGTGGVSSGAEAIEMIMAGATLISLGTAVLHHGIDVFQKITQEMETWCQQNNIANLQKIIACINK